MNIKETVRKQISSLVDKAVADCGFEAVAYQVETPREKANGDFSTNAAMLLTKIAKKAPRMIAEELVSKMDCNGTYIEKLGLTYPNIKDGRSYYEEYTKILLELFDHDVNVWYFPCAYTTRLWSGGTADEYYCIAHLKFFANLLKKQKNQGGIVLYTYSQFNQKEIGLSKHLIVKNKENNKQLLYPEHKKWKNYSTLFKDITTQFRNTKAPHATFNFN